MEIETYNMVTNEVKINPKMITLARESRGLTQRELADLIGISPGKLCKVEQDNQSFNEDLEETLSNVLNYPISFFQQEGEALPMLLNFRKRVNVAQKLMMPIEAQTNIYRLNIERLLKSMKHPEPKIPVLDVKDYGSPVAVAKQLRKLWKVPKGAIANMIDLLEERGIIVVSFDFGTERVDCRTILAESGHPLIVINKAMLGDRQRFSLAFELGHLVMHIFTMPDAKRDINREAGIFAAEFLMPEDEIKKELEGDLTIPRLAELKPKWKVSMQALLYRADDLGLITPNQKRYLLGQFNTLKIRRREPPELDVQQEKPRLLRDMITRYRKAQKMTASKMADFLTWNFKSSLKNMQNER